MRLLIAGDLVPTRSNMNLFNNADINTLLGKELSEIFNSVDIRILNLEVPLTDKEEPIDKCGPNLIAPTSSIKGIKALNPSLITLANNHILDQGMLGLKSTEGILNENDIPFIGAGKDLKDASKPHIIKNGNLNIGIYACAENEFTIATKNTCGANPFDPLESLDHIQKLKSLCDYVIVLYHGGKEHYRYPSPYLQKVCRKICEKGADIVICQHSHCIGSFENYNESTIVYGQGNFIFDRQENEFWNTSILAHININDGINVEYIPIVKQGNVIRLAKKEESQKILREFNERSSKILIDGFVEKEYAKVAKYSREMYLRSFSSFWKWTARIDKYLFKGRLLKYKYDNKKLLTIQNYIECEAHRELVLTFLKGEISSGRK